MFSVSSLLSVPVPEQVHRLLGSPGGLQYERLTNGHDWGQLQRPTKSKYKVYASIVCALLVLLLCLKGALDTQTNL